MIDQVEFVKTMAMIEAGYPRYEPKKDTVSVYYEVLGDLPLDLLQAAVLQWISSDSPWPPSPGQLRAAAFKLIEHTEGRLTAGEAWKEALDKINSWNPPGAEDFSDPLVYEALESIGGNRLLCMSMEDSLTSSRARFIQAYEALRGRERTETRMLPQVRELATLMAGKAVKQIEGGENE